MQMKNLTMKNLTMKTTGASSDAVKLFQEKCQIPKSGQRRVLSLPCKGACLV